MTADITLTSNATGITLPGSEGALVFVKLSETPDTSVRRVNATASSYPRDVTIIQQERKLGTRQAVRRTQVIVKERDWTTVVPLESGVGGRADGEATVIITVIRPLAPGYQTTFSTAKINTLLGTAINLFNTAGSNVLAGEK